ncbi:CBM35 domain-containing protein [Paenibacillus sp. IHBB 3054]|uniref:CBM35 domain-containing protein n=1 Tax=Paenibacillus sp. IHBB 3054 TaxID=3425689 RepID=UPI003F671967
MKKKSLIMLSFAIILSLLLSGISNADVTSNYVNPLMGGADPTIAKAADGYYYSAFSGDNNITLKRHETILGVSTAKSKIVWKKPSNFGFVWGPYIYRLEGKWYIYFSSGPEKSFGYGHPSSYVLENSSPDPFEGTWELKGESANADSDGQITTKKGLLNTQGYGLACGVVSIKGESYFTYTKYYYFPDPNDPAKTKFDESPTIVKMKNPWTLEGEEATVAMPQYDWEKHHDSINEGAAVVERNGKIYFAYSASSFMNDNYSVGVSVADATSDVMKAESWKKHPEPVMKRSDENSSYGPGSPLFLKSEDGTEDWIMYHGIPTHGQGGGNRGIRAQRINWNDNDFINPGIPSNPGTILGRPSGEEKSEIYEAEDARLSGVSKVVGKSAYASSSVYEKFNNSSDNDYVEFTVNTNATGTYSLDFRYNNNTADTVNMKLGVNQEASRTISFTSNAGFDANFDLKSAYNIKLNAGSNKIRLFGKSTLALDAMIIKRSTLYEAESAELSGNAKVDKNHPGYSGTGFAGGLWISNSAVTFKVNAANAGNYSVKLGYSLGFNDDRTMSMYVNGQKIKQVDFFSLKNWDNWADRYDNVFLNEGENTIMYKYDQGDTGNVNLDYITVTEATTWHYGAENAKTTGSTDAKVVYAKDGNMGIGYVTGLSKANSSVEFSINVENAASYDVKLRYAKETAGKTLGLYLNGKYVKNITFPATGGLTVWREKLETLSLKEGKNTITYKSETDNSGIINMDSIHLNKRTPWRYQAEEATREGSLKIAKDHLWYEGNGFVAGFEQEGDSIKYEVNVPNTASYTSTLRYSGAQKSNITMTMYVNEERIKQVSLPPTVNWDTWTDATESVNLKAGKNVIKFIRKAGDTGKFNIDSLTIDKFSGGYMSSSAKKIIPEKMVKIQPKHSGKALDVDKVSSDPKAVINQWANGDGNNQLWRFLDLGTGYYQIQSVQSGHVIDILSGSAIQQICQNIKASGDSIPDTQQWKLEKDGDYYKIMNKSNRKIITVEGASNNDGATVRLADDQAKDNQRMRIEIRNLSYSEFSAVTEVSKVTADDAEINPESVNYDLHAPGDASTIITWNKASSVTEVVYNGNPVIPDGYVVTGNTLTIKSGYLAALGLANSNKAEFTISFDTGNPVKFTVNIVDSSPPVSHSITVETEGRGTASANVASAAKDTEVTLTAIPEAGYIFKEWKVIRPIGLNIAGNTFTMPDEAVTVKAIFEESPGAN